MTPEEKVSFLEKEAATRAQRKQAARAAKTVVDIRGAGIQKPNLKTKKTNTITSDAHLGKYPVSYIVNDPRSRKALSQSAAETLCRFHPNCTKPDCPYLHKVDAADQTTTETLCRFYPKCTKPACRYLHNVQKVKVQETILCKSKLACTKSDCPIAHKTTSAPEGATIDLRRFVISEVRARIAHVGESIQVPQWQRQKVNE